MMRSLVAIVDDGDYDEREESLCEEDLQREVVGIERVICGGF